MKLQVALIFACIFTIQGKGIFPKSKLAAKLDPNSVTVGGISTGGAFASQFLVAYSSLVKGAGIFAAATNYCFYFYNASLTCKDFPEEVDLDSLIIQTRILEDLGEIDATNNLATAQVFISHGLKDATVNPGFAQLTKNYFELWLADSTHLSMLDDLPANHAVMTNGRGSECGIANPPLFVEDCGYESIEAMFNHLYDGMKPTNAFGHWTGTIGTFSQNEYFRSYASQGDLAYYYVPKICEEDVDANCLLHVYFHGCTMSATDIGTQFFLQSGLLEMADANNIVLILPQLKSDASVGNPYGCWNWNGYLGDFENALYGSKNAVQMEGIYNMIKAALE